MSFAVFHIPTLHGESGQAELNVFLRSHRVLKVERHFVPDGDHSFWTFCVDYLEATSGSVSGTGSKARATAVDYREVLKPEEFALFSALRDFRKQIAQAESIPVYVVFTNEQLAQIAQNSVSTKAELEKIDGVGGARIEKYGDRLLACLAQLRNSASIDKAADKATDKPAE